MGRCQADEIHRHNYLGNSLMAPVGRWQKGKDLQWYTKTKDQKAASQEIADVQQRERLAMARELGVEVPEDFPDERPSGEGIPEKVAHEKKEFIEVETKKRKKKKKKKKVKVKKRRKKEKTNNDKTRRQRAWMKSCLKPRSSFLKR